MRQLKRLSQHQKRHTIRHLQVHKSPCMHQVRRHNQTRSTPTTACDDEVMQMQSQLQLIPTQWGIAVHPRGLHHHAYLMVHQYTNYYMDQHGMIDLTIKEANITGAKDEHLPYPTDAQQPPLSKMDCPTNDVDRATCQKYPYRRVVGQLMHGMVHTMVGIVYALNILLDTERILVPDTYFSSSTY